MTIQFISESDRPGPTMNATRGYLAIMINNFSAARLTGILHRIAGPRYRASTCAGVYAIIKQSDGNRTESVRGKSWPEVLDKAKARWEWDIKLPATDKEGSHGQQ